MYDINFCRENAQYFPALADGEINPPGRSPQDVVGPIDRKILRNTDREFVEKLMYYPYDNVDFQDEEVNEGEQQRLRRQQQHQQ